MAQKNTVIVRMESTATIVKPNGVEKPTGYSITTTKNNRTHPDKMEFRRFDPIARKHVIFKEKKK